MTTYTITEAQRQQLLDVSLASLSTTNTLATKMLQSLTPNGGKAVAWSVTVGSDYKNCIEITHCKEDAVAQYEESTAGGFESIYTLHELFANPAPSTSHDALFDNSDAHLLNDAGDDWEAAPSTSQLTDWEIAAAIEATDAKWADADVPLGWAKHFARAIELKIKGGE